MSPLSIILYISWLLFLLFTVDAYKRWKLNLLHFVVFLGWLIIVLLGLFYPPFLERFSAIFGFARGADILVYGGMIFLAYMFFDLNNKITKQDYTFTKFVTNEALSHVSSDHISNISKNIASSETDVKGIKKSDFMFLVKWLNESKTIWHVIDEIINAWYSKILVIDDGSSDNMSDIVEKKINKYKDKLIVLLRHKLNRKHGWWNKTGIEFFRRYWDICRVKYVVFFDADDQMDIKDMEVFEKTINENPSIEVILWSRFIKWGIAKDIPLSRRLILWWWNIITRIFNGLKVSDPHNGYKCIRLDILKKINIQTDTTAYANELVDEYRRLRVNMKEVPVNIKYTEYSLEKWQKNSNAINILLEMIYNKLFFR